MNTGIPHAIVGFLIGAVCCAGAELALGQSSHSLALVSGQPNLANVASFNPASFNPANVASFASPASEQKSAKPIPASADRQTAQATVPAGGTSAVVVGNCPCPQPKYVRSSTSYAVQKVDTYVELDTDAGVPLTVTLPAAPDPLERHEIWLGAQPGLPGGTVTIDTAGQAFELFGSADLALDAANTGVVLLFVQPQPPPAGGYWRVSGL